MLLGVDDLIKTMQDLPVDIQKKVMNRWLLKYARMAAVAAKAAAPRGKTGNLAKSIKGSSARKRTLQKKGVDARAVAFGFSKHFHLINMGTKPRYTKGRGFFRVRSFRGAVPMNPFFQRATQSTLDAAKSDTKAGLAVEVQKVIDAAVRRNKKALRV